MMKPFEMKSAAIAFALAMFVGNISAEATPFFPVVDIGDAFTGQFSIDPTTPTIFGGSLNGYVSPSIGSITVNVGGASFSGPITLVQSEVYAVSGGAYQYSWGAGQDQSLPEATRVISYGAIPLPFGLISLQLIGSTTSTGAILPESFSSYRSSGLVIFAHSPDGAWGAELWAKVGDGMKG